MCPQNPCSREAMNRNPEGFAVAVVTIPLDAMKLLAFTPTGTLHSPLSEEGHAPLYSHHTCYYGRNFCMR